MVDAFSDWSLHRGVFGCLACARLSTVVFSQIVCALVDPLNSRTKNQLDETVDVGLSLSVHRHVRLRHVMFVS